MSDRSRSRDSSGNDPRYTTNREIMQERGRPTYREDKGFQRKSNNRDDLYENNRGGKYDKFQSNRPNGKGKNCHMGEVHSFTSQLKDSVGLSEKAVLSVINPSPSDRDRSNYTANVSNKTIPRNANWRMSPYIGAAVSDKIISNHFRIEDTRTIPRYIFHYDVKIRKFDRQGMLVDDDVAVSGKDDLFNSTLINSIRSRNKFWQTTSSNEIIGLTYDGLSRLMTTARLPTSSEADGPTRDDEHDAIECNQAIIDEDVSLPGSAVKYRVTLTLVASIGPFPTVDDISWGKLSPNLLNALQSCVYSFSQESTSNNRWFLNNSRVYPSCSASRDREQLEKVSVRLNDVLLAIKGYSASLKSCLAGLVLVVDLTVNCFLQGGDLVEIMMVLGGFKNMEEMLDHSRRYHGFHSSVNDKLTQSLKSAKLKLKHLAFTKKLRGFGPSSNMHKFECDGNLITVEQYFRTKYSSIEFRYPELPLLDVGGTKAKPCYLPPEFAFMPEGQTRNRALTPAMAADLIRMAAVRPQERFNYLCNPNGIVPQIRSNETSAAFGLGSISATPMIVSATLLPSARILYQNEIVVEPNLAGTWNIPRFTKFSIPAISSGSIRFSCIAIFQGRPERDCDSLANSFLSAFEREGKFFGLPLQQANLSICLNEESRIQDELLEAKRASNRFVVVLLGCDCYSLVKLLADKMNIVTQCIKWKNVAKTPSSYHANVMLKLNTKLGGVNHTLASRLPVSEWPAAPVFQSPPASISWLFDRPCMFLGIDVSHPESGMSGSSVGAVVASMDGCAGQYCAHISFQDERQELLQNLSEAVSELLELFKRKNGCFPSRIIVYRDGVGEGNFEKVISVELVAIQTAIEHSTAYHGQLSTIPVAIVVCQKRHNSRFAYASNGTEAESEFVNLCPGVCIDAAGGMNSVASMVMNEFYLNSHVAIQGTAKPCRYSLLYDQIGFKLSELELLTYWTTYLYCRCNKSVSYATPAYYAHWAARRGRTLLSANATSTQIKKICTDWSNADQGSMFFI